MGRLFFVTSSLLSYFFMDEPDGERKRRGSASQVEAVYSLPPSLPPQPRPGPSRPLAALPPISHHIDDDDARTVVASPGKIRSKSTKSMTDNEMADAMELADLRDSCAKKSVEKLYEKLGEVKAEAAKAKKKAEKKHGEEGQAKYAQKLAKIVRKQSYIEEEIERRKEQEDRKQQKRDEKEAKRNSVPVGV